MPPYKVFISYSSHNRSTAKVIADVLQEAFGDNIDPYVAVLKIGAGAVWQKDIKDNLQDKDALISVVTPRFVRKDWFFIEWSPFWLSEKPYFLLLSDDVSKSDLVPAMTDRQHTALHDPDSIKLLFQELHAAIFGENDAKKDYRPYVDKLRTEVSTSLEREELDYFETFRDPNEKLPADLNKVEAILEYFYNKYIATTGADKDYFYNQYKDKLGVDIDNLNPDKAALTINIDKLDDEDKFRVARIALQRNKPGLAMFLCEAIPNAHHLHRIADQMIEMGLFNAPELFAITSILKIKSTVANHRIALKLIEHNQTEGELLYHNVVDLDNLEQLKRIYVEMLQRKNHNTQVQGLMLDRRKAVKKGTSYVEILTLILDKMVKRGAIANHVKNYIKKVKEEVPLLLPVLRESVAIMPPGDDVTKTLAMFDDSNL